MVEAILVPRRVVEEARKRGLDIEEVILWVLARELELDPVDTAEAQIELAIHFLEEAKECIARGDAV